MSSTENNNSSSDVQEIEENTQEEEESSSFSSSDPFASDAPNDKDSDFQPDQKQSEEEEDESFTAAEESSDPWEETNTSGPLIETYLEEGELYFVFLAEDGEKKLPLSKARIEYPMEVISFFERKIFVGKKH